MINRVCFQLMRIQVNFCQWILTTLPTAFASGALTKMRQPLRVSAKRGVIQTDAAAIRLVHSARHCAIPNRSAITADVR